MGECPVVVLLSLLCASGCVCVSQLDASGSCRDFGEAFERIFTVPGEAVLLECSMDISHLFNPELVSYNITWFSQQTGAEVTAQNNSIILTQTNLWLINVTLQDQGRYTCVIRTSEECYRQTSVLLVSEMTSGDCVKPQTGLQRVRAGATGLLACPLRAYSASVDQFTFHWYKNCDLIESSEKMEPRSDMLYIHRAAGGDRGFYSCRMSFRLGGVSAEMSESIECEVQEDHLMKPLILQPLNERVKVKTGSSFRKDCVVMVPGKGFSLVEVLWKVRVGPGEEFISQNTSQRLHQTPLILSQLENGVQLVRTLWLWDVLEEDLYRNFSCLVSSGRGHSTAQFTLLPSDPPLLFPVLLLLTSLVLLLVLVLLLCTVFRIRLILWFRSKFPFFYKSTDGDGKLYDAYIAFPRVLQRSREAELFSMTTLPRVLEGRFGYRLFIRGRDDGPGEAAADAVQDALSCCRRLLLLYTASSLCWAESVEWAEQQSGLYRALVEEEVRVVLLEMEEVRNPRGLPEAVRLIRDRQGALRAWRRRRDGGNVLGPSDAFWRELRFHMPVRGGATVHRGLLCL